MKTSLLATFTLFATGPLIGHIHAADTTAAKNPRKPNIIFIMADDLGYGDLSMDGQKKFKTPNIDNLAKEGLTFANAYAGSTICGPSRCALLTGLHTGHAVIRGNAPESSNFLPDDNPSVARLLKNGGYATGCFGKWGMGLPANAGSPSRQGFDEFVGFMTHMEGHFHFVNNIWYGDEKRSHSEQVYSQKVFFDSAADFIKRNKDKPFFIYLAPTIPHASLEATDEDMAPFKGKFPEKPWGKPDGQHYRYQATPHAAFAAMVTRLDKDVGKITSLIDELGLAKDTIIVFTSDNGPHQEGGADPKFFNGSGPFRGIKRDLTDGGVHVPFIARWPNTIKAGTKTDNFWAHWDLLPTVADLAGLPVPKGLDGVSLAPTFKGQKQPEHPPLYWEFYERGWKQQAVRDGKWKGVYEKKEAPMSLYDIERDPGEKTNLAKSNPEIVKKLEAIIEASHTPMKERKGKK
ncbi:MAG: arylsulfatase [Puniceicoccales bacterium]|jgi:arylsulfatase A-like enzyme|nr:arylsulfatase [Puniceicoccales bacterium]